MRVPWTARRSNQSFRKEINPEYSLEGLMVKVKVQYFGYLMWRKDSWKDSDAGKDEVVGQHHGLNGHEFKQAPGDTEGQESSACCSPYGCKELDVTERLNWSLVTIGHQAPLCTGFPRPEFCIRLLFTSPGDLPNPGIKPASPALAGGFCTTEPSGKPSFLIREENW